MEKKEIKGLNEYLYVHKTKSGLNVYMWVNEKVNSMYATINVRYGSVHRDFKVGNKRYKVPSGIAHFLEHIKFNISDDVTATDIFNEYGADCNAFTTYDYTSYEVVTTGNKKECVSNLVELVFKSYFTEKIVENEKDIIVEELKMGLDSTYNSIFNKIIENIFVKSDYRIPVIGTEEDVRSVTLDDINNIYNAYYHPKNSFCCITGNFNPYEIAKVIDEKLEELDIKECPDVVTNMAEETDNVKLNYEEIELPINIPRVCYGFKIPIKKFKNYEYNTLANIISLYFGGSIGLTSTFNEELRNEGIVNNFWFNFNKLGDYMVMNLFADTEYPEEYIKVMDKKLNNLEINEEDIIRKRNSCVANVILKFDSIEEIALIMEEDILYKGDVDYNKKETFENITIKDVKDVASKLDLNNRCVLLCKPKKNN